MKWHYAAGRKVDKYGVPYWGVYEVYERAGPNVWTERHMRPYGETRLELVDDITRMLKDCCYFPAIDADAESYTEIDTEQAPPRAYCVRCRKKVPMLGAQSVTMKNGKEATHGKCGTCGAELFRIGELG